MENKTLTEGMKVAETVDGALATELHNKEIELNSLKFNITSWLGRWRDELPPEAIEVLQDILEIH